MTNVYSFDGIVVFGLLYICTCAYLKKVPRLNSWLLSEKKGVWGVFYKGKTINLSMVHLCNRTMEYKYWLCVSDYNQRAMLQLHHSEAERFTTTASPQ
uniref:Protein kish n=1 Tax=Oncorhynchus kisutch TaxID=8019 RepID=A0A8C7I1E3_ONCKI